MPTEPNKVYLTVTDDQTVRAHWHVSQSKQKMVDSYFGEAVSKALRGVRLFRLYESEEVKVADYRDAFVKGEVDSCTIRNVAPGQYKAQFGLFQNGHFFPLAHSERVTVSKREDRVEREEQVRAAHVPPIPTFYNRLSRGPLPGFAGPEPFPTVYERFGAGPGPVPTSYSVSPYSASSYFVVSNYALPFAPSAYPVSIVTYSFPTNLVCESYAPLTVSGYSASGNLVFGVTSYGR
ncbi:hypothetical protein [Mechercharimyces sp. CAU 1602]|uniref:hypothetical protein n=1 Tax=Mechercharimyces sp. CAU 1602 TaxID=2973933 RepID=UPI0021629841|nr:hypothetical protein [Mechercharimyces sp. CAU 1602]MCS1350122.1 hypothetical protein [Mechercharimyces sp. CAU 1602]